MSLSLEQRRKLSLRRPTNVKFADEFGMNLNTFLMIPCRVAARRSAAVKAAAINARLFSLDEFTPGGGFRSGGGGDGLVQVATSSTTGAGYQGYADMIFQKIRSTTDDAVSFAILILRYRIKFGCFALDISRKISVQLS